MDATNYEEDDDDVITDPEFLQSVLQSLPGVDPESEAVRQVMNEITQSKRDDSSSSDKKEEGK